jgi:hypothetical protein
LPAAILALKPPEKPLPLKVKLLRYLRLFKRNKPSKRDKTFFAGKVKLQQRLEKRKHRL